MPALGTPDRPEVDGQFAMALATHVSRWCGGRCHAEIPCEDDCTELIDEESQCTSVALVVAVSIRGAQVHLHRSVQPRPVDGPESRKISRQQVEHLPLADSRVRD